MWAWSNPDVYAVQAETGDVDVIPEYVVIVQEARYWGVTPMAIMDMPVEWIQAGQIVRRAEQEVQQIAQEQRNRRR